jgi:insulysin
MEQPSVDKRQYQHVVLGDPQSHYQMDVLLISDPETDKASAAMDIYIGQLCDPPTLPGLAHFCEHMLFIGTNKYPTENAYDQYLSSHGGSSNAFTDLDHTCYYFDVQAESLDGALDRFAQCFISPLFTQSALEREVQAVDSEHGKNLMQDPWRMYQLSKSTIAPPDHPFASFGSGNAQTLPIATIREQLLQFFERYYRRSLQLYKLVVLGKEPLPELQSLVEKYFTELVEAFTSSANGNGGTDAAAAAAAAAGGGGGGGANTMTVDRSHLLEEIYHQTTQTSSSWKVPQRLHVVPVSQIHAVEMQFPMREVLSVYMSKPTRYISHLIGHEGKGSLLSLLKSRHYATELYADGGNKSCVHWSMFTIRMELTDAGLENVNEVVAMVFAYIDLLKVQGPQEWIHNEVQTVGDLQFRFLSQRNHMDYTSSVAGWMQQFPPQHYLSGTYKIYEWDGPLVNECLTALTPDNMFLMISSPTFDETLSSSSSSSSAKIEKWYGTKYEIVECNPTVLEQWRQAQHKSYPELSKPQVNDMIATDFELLSTESLPIDTPVDRPQCIHQDENVRLWYKPDNVFDMPKVNIMFSFTSGQGPMSPDSTVAAHLFAELVQEQCNEFSYLATMAGLYCDISPTSTGMELHITGYNHKAHVLVERLVDTIMDLIVDDQNIEDNNKGVDGGDDTDTGDKKERATKLDPEVFARVLFKTEQLYQSFLVSQPYSHAIYGGDLLLEQNQCSIHDKMNALKGITLEEVISFARGFWKYCKMEGLVHGNVTPQHAYDMANLVWQKTHPKQPLSTQAIISRAPLERRVIQLLDNSSSDGASSSYLYRFAGFNEADSNSCVEIVFQMGVLDMPTNASLALFNHLVREPAFNQLRTEEQLGYIVHTSVKTMGDHIKGFLLLIQSDAFEPVHVEGRIETFLQGFRKRITDMSDEDFQTNVDAVVASFLEKVRVIRSLNTFLVVM